LISQGTIIGLTKKEYKSSESNPLQWFGTNLIQYLNRQQDTEICPLYGKMINTLDDFCYQLCRSIPWGFEMGRNIDAVYDVILNFETIPQNRYFIWYDSQTLFKKNKILFDSIFECIIVAGYLNSIGQATCDYKVNQRNIFLFDEIDKRDLQYLLDKEYYTPKINDISQNEKEKYLKHSFVTVLIK
jgi:hypothetical protein